MTRTMKFMTGWFLLLLIAANASSALAEEAKAEVSLESAVEPEKDADTWKAPWRGTSIIYRNAATARSFDKGADLTYNPYYEMSWAFHPQWWVGDVFNTSIDFALSRELTEADDTTYADETLFSDVTWTLAASKFATIPGIGVGLSANVGLIAPTSKASQAKTMVFGLRPGLSLSKNFDVLAGISLGYSFGISKFFYEATTAQSLAPTITNCSTSAGGCEEYQNTGFRNASWGLSNGFSLSIAFIEQLSLDANFGMKHSFLFAQENDETTSLDGTDTTSTTEYDVMESEYSNDKNIRYGMVYGLGLTISPIPALSLALGAETGNPQLKANGTYERPFFNRNTVVFLDLTLSIDGLVTQLTSNEK